MPIKRNKRWKALVKMADKKTVRKAMSKHLSIANLQAAEIIRRAIILGIRNQRKEWPALKPSTIAAKKKSGGSSLTLIDKGEMFRAITTKKIGKLAAFVGIPRGVKAKKGNAAGTPIALYGAVHEFGAMIKRGSTVIKIPKRSFIEPAIKETEKDVNKLYVKATENAIREVLET